MKRECGLLFKRCNVCSRMFCFIEALLPHTLAVKAGRFFLEMAHAVSFETVCAAAGQAVVLSQQHYSELTLSWYQPTSPLVSEEGINHFSRNTHLF